MYYVHGNMMLTFIELSGFSKRRAELLTDDSFKEMQESIIINPQIGSVISGTGGFRKLRWARPGSGKRAEFVSFTTTDVKSLEEFTWLCCTRKMKLIT
jgi:hypothetical protein